jgi:hypothetical protein
LKIKAGWAKVCFEIPEGVALAGYEGGKPRCSAGTHDPLYVRVLTLEREGRRFCLASCDVLALDAAFVEALAVKAGNRGIAAEDFFIAATHTHSGPGGLFVGDGDLDALLEFIMGRPDPSLIKTLEDRVLLAIERSVGNMKPCTLSSSVTESPGIGGNRNEPGRAGDPYLSVLKVETEDGDQVLLYSTACHPTVLNGENLLASADFPGETSRLLEQGPVRAALFFNGSAGDVSTRYTRRGAGFDEVRRLARMLARQVTEAAARAARWEDPVPESSRISVNLAMRRGPDPEEAAETLSRLKAEFAAAKESGTGTAGGLRLLEARCEGAMLGLLYSRHRPRTQSRSVTVRFLRAGRLVFAFFPVELFSVLSNPLREQRPWLVPVSYAGGYLGYLPDVAIENTDNYEKYITVFAYGQGERLMAEVRRHLEECYAE